MIWSGKAIGCVFYPVTEINSGGVLSLPVGTACAYQNLNLSTYSGRCEGQACARVAGADTLLLGSGYVFFVDSLSEFNDQIVDSVRTGHLRAVTG